MDEAQIDQELQAAIALLRLDALDRIYSRHSRPRWAIACLGFLFNFLLCMIWVCAIVHTILMIDYIADMKVLVNS